MITIENLYFRGTIIPQKDKPLPGPCPVVHERVNTPAGPDPHPAGDVLNTICTGPYPHPALHDLATADPGSHPARDPEGSVLNSIGTGPDPHPAGRDPKIICPGSHPARDPAGIILNIIGNVEDLHPALHDPAIAGPGSHPDMDPFSEEDEPGRTAELCTRLLGWQAHLPGRLRKKLATFDRSIGAFHQRRWS